MKDIQYILNEEYVQVEEERVLSYGISCIQKGILLSSIPDISPVKETVLKLIDKCNEEELSPVHLKEIAEDFLP